MKDGRCDSAPPHRRIVGPGRQPNGGPAAFGPHEHAFAFSVHRDGPTVRSDGRIIGVQNGGRAEDPAGENGGGNAHVSTAVYLVEYQNTVAQGIDDKARILFHEVGVRGDRGGILIPGGTVVAG
jgi:hypothetical protein